MMLTCLLSKKLAKYLYGDKKFVIAASCSVSDDYSAMGVKIDNMDIPVCNSFQDKILNNKHCYEIDLNRFTNQHVCLILRMYWKKR